MALGFKSYIRYEINIIIGFVDFVYVQNTQGLFHDSRGFSLIINESIIGIIISFNIKY